MPRSTLLTQCSRQLEGTIQPGSDADFVIWRNPAERQASTITVKNVRSFVSFSPVHVLLVNLRGIRLFKRQMHSACDYTPFEGHEVLDWPLLTILRGKIVYNGTSNEVVGEKGYGRFLKRGKSGLRGPTGKWVNEWRPEYLS